MKIIARAMNCVLSYKAVTRKNISGGNFYSLNVYYFSEGYFFDEISCFLKEIVEFKWKILGTAGAKKS